MSYIKSCNFCGQKISMREMRDGHWVAFDASTETAHQCGRKTKPDPSIAALGAKNKKKEEPGGIDIGYSNDVSENEQASTINQSNHHTLDTWIDKQSEVTDNRELSEGKVWIDERAKVSDENKNKRIWKEGWGIFFWAFFIAIIVLIMFAQD